MKTCPYCGEKLPDYAEFCSRCGAHLLAPSERPYPPEASPAYGYQAVYPQIRFAGFWVRLAAIMIDGSILGVALAPVWIWYPLSNLWTANNGGETGLSWSGLRFLLIFAAVTLYVLYGTLMLGKFGATLGKMAMGIKVVATDLRPVSYGWALLRETVGKWISSLICDLGYIWAAFDPKKQAWHDHLARTLVIYR